MQTSLLGRGVCECGRFVLNQWVMYLVLKQRESKITMNEAIFNVPIWDLPHNLHVWACPSFPQQHFRPACIIHLRWPQKHGFSSFGIHTSQSPHPKLSLEYTKADKTKLCPYGHQRAASAVSSRLHYRHFAQRICKCSKEGREYKKSSTLSSFPQCHVMHILC